MIVIQTDASINHPFFTDQTHLNIFMKINTHGMIMGYHEDQTQTKQTHRGSFFTFHSRQVVEPPFFPSATWHFLVGLGQIAAGHSRAHGETQVIREVQPVLDEPVRRPPLNGERPKSPSWMENLEMWRNQPVGMLYHVISRYKWI